MKTSKQAASILLTTAIVSAGAAYTLPSASFAGAGSTVQIDNQGKDLEGISYNGYKIFSSDFHTDGQAKNVQWPDVQSDGTSAMKDIVEGVLTDFSSGDYTGATAFDALQYIADNMPKQAEGESAPVLANDSLGNKLAIAIEQAAVAGTITASATASSAQAAEDLTDGYYLFCADHSTLNEGEGVTVQTATAPAFVAVNGARTEPVVIVPKTDIPTLHKYVQEDSTSQFGTRADADRNQEVTFKLVGTVPSEINTYDAYRYAFVDVIENGLTVTMDDTDPTKPAVTVKAGADEASATAVPASEYEAVLDADTNTVTVTFADAKEHAGETIFVTYRAALNDQATVGTADDKSNSSKAHIKYSNNPHVAAVDASGSEVESAMSSSADQTVDVYTYELDFHKVAQDDLTKDLSGVQFTIQNEQGDYLDDQGRVIEQKVDQHSADLPQEAIHSTDNEGKFSIIGVDAGTYTITEVKAPNGYVSLRSDFEVTLKSEIEGTLDPGKSGIDATFDAKTNADLIGLDPDNPVSGANGTVGYRVQNAPTVLGLPITGAEGVTAVCIASGVFVAGALTIIIRREVKKAKSVKAKA